MTSLGPLLALARAAPPLPPEQLDSSLEPPVIETRPGPQYQDEARTANMIIGLANPRRRLWAVGSERDNPNGYFCWPPAATARTPGPRPSGASNPTIRPTRRSDDVGRQPLDRSQGRCGCSSTKPGSFDAGPANGRFAVTTPMPISALDRAGSDRRWLHLCSTRPVDGDWLLPVRSGPRELIMRRSSRSVIRTSTASGWPTSSSRPTRVEPGRGGAAWRSRRPPSTST